MLTFTPVLRNAPGAAAYDDQVVKCEVTQAIPTPSTNDVVRFSDQQLIVLGKIWYYVLVHAETILVGDINPTKMKDKLETAPFRRGRIKLGGM